MENTPAKVFNGIPVPDGEKIIVKDGKATTPSRPIIPFIEGDGIGSEIWGAARRIFDAAVRSAYGDARQIVWYEVLAGDKAKAKTGKQLPDDTLAALKEFGVSIKGPLGTPTGGGFRSLNVTMRQELDLFRCVRPVRYFDGVPSVVKRPQDLDVVIFRENTEDVYAGIEFAVDSEIAREIIALLSKHGIPVRDDSGFGIKPISRFCSKRLVREAIKYAIDNGRKVVTLVHKGNIQKYTEGAFRDWGYEVAKEEFRDQIVTDEELWGQHGGKMPDGKILINDRIADAMFFEALVKPTTFSVIATTNLNGDYLSDACAAQVGGLGIAPGANIGDNYAIFEATHGTAPRIAGKNEANPTSLILSGVMMLEYMGWTEAAKLIVSAIEQVIIDKTCTGDLADYMDNATKLGTREFADVVIAKLPPAPEPVLPATDPAVDGETAAAPVDGETADAGAGANAAAPVDGETADAGAGANAAAPVDGETAAVPAVVAAPATTTAVEK